MRRLKSRPQEPYYSRMGVDLYHSDALSFLRSQPSQSFDALVTDPPAGIGFMGKHWDKNKGGRAGWVAWLAGIMTEALRVLKPGAHGLVWSLPRTSHWTGSALEDAGFEVRDLVLHLFGTGWPKSHNVSKAIDDAVGAQRRIVGRGGSNCPFLGRGEECRCCEREGASYVGKHVPETAPATAAAAWHGWGTALKPAMEPWWLVRKPLDGTVVENVLEHGVGAVNIDACRVGDELRHNPSASIGADRHASGGGWSEKSGRPPVGRWPANVVLSHSPGCVRVGSHVVKRSVGRNVDGERTPGYGGGAKSARAFEEEEEEVDAYECVPGCPVRAIDAQAGAASRFFNAFEPDADPAYYAAKPSTAERNAWGAASNRHPCLKGQALMRHFVRLVTPPGGRVLDCFAGSGSTLIAARAEGFSAVGCELEEESCATAAARLDAPRHLRRRRVK